VGSIRVGIFGCGWLGRPLAKGLQSHYSVYGAVRSLASFSQLQKEKITAFQMPNQDSEFWNVDTLVIAISPRHNYLETIKEISKNVNARTQQLILLSTTSVYKDQKTLVNETSEVDASTIALQGERLFKNHFLKGIIIRLGGLMGEDRIAGQWGTPVVKDSLVNYIHQVDAIGIILEVIKQGINDEIVNAVAPEHPKRSEVYKINCEHFGWKLPMFIEGVERTVCSAKSELLLGFEYQFKDPKHFWSDS